MFALLPVFLGCSAPLLNGVWDQEPIGKYENSIEFRSDGTFLGVAILEDTKRSAALIKGLTRGTYSVHGNEVTQSVDEVELNTIGPDGKERPLRKSNPHYRVVMKISFEGSDLIHTAYRTPDGFEITGALKRRR